MPDQYIIDTLLFRRCEYWDTDTCPYRNKAVMALSVINSANLFLLSDETVAELNTTCEGCDTFTKKISAEHKI